MPDPLFSLSNPEKLARRAFLRRLVVAGAGLAIAPGLAQLLAACRQDAVPKRVARAEMILRTSRPRNLETPVSSFDQFLTPNEVFFVRSHHDEPRLDPSTWRLKIKGLVGNELSLSLDELKAFEKVKLPAVLQCSGNGRAFFSGPKVPGVLWEKGAVGNAEWAGVRLSDVLSRAGVDGKAHYVVMQGADTPVISNTPRFERSIPLAKAMHPDTLLAYEMNGEPLPHLHGFPLRVVAPGWVGDDWVKWLSELTLTEHESQSFWYQTAYRYPKKPLTPGQKVDPHTQMAPMEEMVVKSLIVAPAVDSTLDRGRVLVSGVAWTGGDARIAKVEVSTDGGSSWKPAELLGQDLPYAWRQWRYAWLARQGGRHVLMARATDTRGHAQPVGKAPWNPSGYHWNAADTVPVTIRA